MSVEMNTRNVFGILRDILIHEMEVDDSRVNLAKQKFLIPPDEKMFIYIDNLGSIQLSSRSKAQEDPNTGNYVEVQDLNTQEKYAIGLFSRSLDAFNRKEEAVMALGSIYSVQKQEANSLQIARISPITDLSALEGAAMLYRYELTVTVLAWRQIIKVVDRFEHFSTEVLDATPGP